MHIVYIFLMIIFIYLHFRSYFCVHYLFIGFVMEFIITTNISFLYECLNNNLAPCYIHTYQLSNEVISHTEMVL